MTPVWPHGDPRVIVRAIVADPRYGGTTQAASPPNLLDRVLQWAGERLVAVLHAIGHALGSNSPFNVAIGVAAIAVGFAALGYAASRLVRVRGRAPERRAVPAVPLEAAVTSCEWFERALLAARAERWRDAAAAVFAAALRALDERGRLSYDPARTAGEARRAVDDPAFDVLARESSFALFDARGATHERFERMRDAYLRSFGPSA